MPSTVPVPMAQYQTSDGLRMPARIRRAARHTVLLVGEGTTDWAFLKHIKSLYISRGCGVSATIRNAHGKGPDHVVDYAIRQCRNADYDRVVTLLDTDLPMSAAVRGRARSKKVRVIESTPCIEGLLLKILGEHVPGTSAECKTRCGDIRIFSTGGGLKFLSLGGCWIIYCSLNSTASIGSFEYDHIG